MVRVRAKKSDPALRIPVVDRDAPTVRAFLADFGWLQIGSAEVFGLGQGVPTYLNLELEMVAEREVFEPGLPAKLLPMMNDGGGNLVCVDCADTREAMALWDHSEGLVDLNQSFCDWLGNRVGLV
jgi:hypothetical protein